MTAANIISRSDMVSAMTGQFNADLNETFLHNWKQTNTVVLEQGDNRVEQTAIDFHLLEIPITGHHRLEGLGEYEHGEALDADLMPGTVGYNQPNVQVTQSVSGFAKLQQIYIDDALVRQTAQSILKGDPDRTQTLGFQGLFVPQIKDLADRLLEEARCPALGSDLRADLISQDIAVLLLRRRDAARVRVPVTSRLSVSEVKRVIEHLEEQIEDLGGMATLAELVDMDVFSFTRAFKATTGQSPHQFLIQRRLTRVKQLLRDTNDSLAEITYATGFSSQPHMTATFTKHVGTSPGKWRKAVRS